MRKMNQIKFVWTFVWTWRRGQIPVQRPVISGRSRQGLGRYHGHLRRLKKEMEIAISTMRSQTKAVAVKLVLVICFFFSSTATANNCQSISSSWNIKCCSGTDTPVCVCQCSNVAAVKKGKRPKLPVWVLSSVWHLPDANWRRCWTCHREAGRQWA